MNKRFPYMIHSDSFLIGILHLIGLLCLYNDSECAKRGRPYVYPTMVMIRCFVVRIWMRIPSNNCLHHYFSINTEHNKKVMKVCGLYSLPDRRTFDRRFKTVPMTRIISNLGKKLTSEGFADTKIISVDSTLICAMGHLWHRSSMMQNVVPHSGIDTDARWGFARTKGWIFGYKLHLSCSAGLLSVPLSADFTAANVPDNSIYCNLIESLSDMQYVVADMGYDDHRLYDYTRQRNARLICPIQRYRHTKSDRLDMIQFYRSKLGQRTYRTRSVSIEPLFQCVKDAFGISVSPVRGFDNARSYVLMCVWCTSWQCIGIV